MAANASSQYAPVTLAPLGSSPTKYGSKCKLSIRSSHPCPLRLLPNQVRQQVQALNTLQSPLPSSAPPEPSMAASASSQYAPVTPAPFGSSPTKYGSKCKLSIRSSHPCPLGLLPNQVWQQVQALYTLQSPLPPWAPPQPSMAASASSQYAPVTPAPFGSSTTKYGSKCKLSIRSSHPCP